MADRPGARRRSGAVAASIAAALLLAACANSPTVQLPTAHLPTVHLSTAHPGVTVADQPVAAKPSRPPSPAAPAPPSWDGTTSQRMFTPYDATGTLTVAAGNRGSGSCFATSIAVPLAGVYRCLADNTLLDPCFAPTRETAPPTVACFASPWSDAQVLTVTGSLPAFQPDLMTGNPWGIELANGATCVAATGAVPSYDGVNLIYACGGQDMAGIDTDANGAITAHYGPADGPLVDVGVVTAWRGRSYRIAG